MKLVLIYHYSCRQH